MTDSDIVLTGPKGRARAGRAHVISTTTRWIGVLMALAVLGGATLDYFSSTGRLGDSQDLVLAGLTLVPLPVAALILWVARSLAKGMVRDQWMMFGLGMLSVGVGNVIFIALYLASGTDPYPSIADAFTLAGYALFAVGLFKAIRAYRGLLNVRQPMLIAAGVSAAVMTLVYFAVIGPYVIFAEDHSMSFALRFFNTLYPMLDVFILLMPAITLGLLVSRLGAGRVAWPWWFVVGSASILAVVDTVFAYAGYTGLGRTPIIDAGYALAPLALGFASLVARDIYNS